MKKPNAADKQCRDLYRASRRRPLRGSRWSAATWRPSRSSGATSPQRRDRARLALAGKEKALGEHHRTYAHDLRAIRRR